MSEVSSVPCSANLKQLKNQAKDLLRAFRSGEPDAVRELAEGHPRSVSPDEAKLTDAQLVLHVGTASTAGQSYVSRQPVPNSVRPLGTETLGEWSKSSNRNLHPWTALEHIQCGTAGRMPFRSPQSVDRSRQLRSSWTVGQM
jgi:hypothetical protein